MAKKTRLEMEYRRFDRPRDIPRDSLSRAELNKRDRGESRATRGNLDVTINVALRGIEEITEQTAINPIGEKIKCRYKSNLIAATCATSMAIAIAVTIIAAVTLAVSGTAEAQPCKQNVPSSNGSFGPIKQIDAGLLNVGYVEAGPTDGTPVILLHGWPYDIYSYVDVAPLLASKGYHVFVPYLRGYGTTRFLSDDTFRNGPTAIAMGSGLFSRSAA